jgi:hypothetical protein
VTLVAVSKTMPAGAVRLAHDAGLRVFGENRAQELLAKSAEIAGCEWHMIGRVQTNKVRALARVVGMWHSVDRSVLVDELARRGVTAPVLLEVNVGDEPNKGGCARAELPRLLDQARDHGLAVRGLMAVPPIGADPRPHFAWLHEAADRHELPELSMGMSGDFEAAIECGATIVRVGTAIFGARNT